MADTFIAWHKEYAPNGREFDMAKDSADALEREGFVDSPAKIGINIWQPNDPDIEAKVAATAAAYEAGQIPGFDREPTVIDPARLAKEEADRQRLQDREKEIEALRTQLSKQEVRAQKAEEELDRVNDGRKIAGKHADKVGDALNPDATRKSQEKLKPLIDAA